MWKLKTGAETVREERNNDEESGGSTGSETWLRTLRERERKERLTMETAAWTPDRTACSDYSLASYNSCTQDDIKKCYGKS